MPSNWHHLRKKNIVTQRDSKTPVTLLPCWDFWKFQTLTSVFNFLKSKVLFIMSGVFEKMKYDSENPKVDEYIIAIKLV